MRSEAAALCLAVLTLAGRAAAETIEVELKGAGPNTAVFALDEKQQPHQAKLLRAGGDRPDSVAKHEIEDLWTCAPEAAGPRLVVLSGDNAANYLDPSAVCAQPEHRKRITVQLAPAPRIRIFVWLRNGELRDRVADQIANANWLFSRNLIGVVLEPEFVDGVSITPTGPNEFQLSRNQNSFVLKPGNPGCQTLGPGNFLEPGGVNIYFGFANLSSVTCHGRAGQDGRVTKDLMFIETAPALGKIAHELSHAFGVDDTDQDPELSYENGHVPPKGADPDKDVNRRDTGERIFEPKNPMWQLSFILQDEFTLGQVFWMNFNRNSSFLAQSRERQPNAAPSLNCPSECPLFKTDYPDHDPREFFPGAAKAKIVGDQKAAKLDSSGPCGGERNQDCPETAVTFVNRFATRLKRAVGLGGQESDFDMRFRLAKGLLDDSPRYCTKEELIESLRKRFDEVCRAPAQCGHQDQAGFIDFWKTAHVTTGLIESAATAAMKAQEQKTGSAAPQTYDQAKDTFSKYSDHLKNAQGKKILWMDTPGANRFEQNLFSAFGIKIDCSANPEQAIRQIQGAGLRKLTFLRRSVYDAVISNFGADQRALKLLQKIKRRGLRVPLIIYSKGVTAENVESAKQQGAFAETDDPVALTELLFKALEQH